MREEWAAHSDFIRTLAHGKGRTMNYWLFGHPVTAKEFRRARWAMRGGFLAVVLASIPLALVDVKWLALTVILALLFPPMELARHEITFLGFGYTSILIRHSIRSQPRSDREKLRKELLRLDGKATKLTRSSSEEVFERYDGLLEEYLGLAERAGAAGLPKPPPIDTAIDTTFSVYKNSRGQNFVQFERGARTVALARIRPLTWESATTCCGAPLAQGVEGLVCSECWAVHLGPAATSLRTDSVEDMAAAALRLAGDFLAIDPLEQAMLAQSLEEFVEHPLLPLR